MSTIVAFHAHPDDEVLLTGGTIARLAAEGHRVIIVVACDGDVLPGPRQGRRLGELRASAAILGAAAAGWLGYADSGPPRDRDWPARSVRTTGRQGWCSIIAPPPIMAVGMEIPATTDG
jgi:LmbE family N-acetylglucosaminyl deacetylase